MSLHKIIENVVQYCDFVRLNGFFKKLKKTVNSDQLQL